MNILKLNLLSEISLFLFKTLYKETTSLRLQYNSNNSFYPMWWLTSLFLYGVELQKTFNTNILNSCPTQGRVEGWDAMKPLYWRSLNSKDSGLTITGENEMKRNWDECGEIVEWNLWQRKRVETLRKTYPDSVSSPRNPHGVTETRTRDPSGWEESG